MLSRSYRTCWTALTLLACVWLSTTPSLAAEADPPAVVSFQNREIAVLRATLGPLSPQQRADGAMDRLAQLIREDHRFEPTIVPYGDSRGIIIGDRMIFGIVPDDVDASAGETVDEVASRAAENLRAALAAWAEQRRPDVVARGVTRVLIASALALVVLLVLRWTRRQIMRRVPARTERAIEKRRMMLFGQDVRGAVLKVVRVLVSIVGVLVSLVAVYAWLTFCLKQFPLTEPWGDQLAGFILGTAGTIGRAILRGIPEVTMVVVILLLTRLCVRIVTSLFNAVEDGKVTLRGVHPDTADATRRITSVLIWVFGIAMAYPFIPGSSSEAFKGISVLLGLMLSLGSSGIISQGMSGMVVVFSRALKVGEYVKVAEYEGTVTDVGALSTKIRTKRNEEINVPNALLVSSMTKNFSRLAASHGVIVFASVGIGYDAPWRTVHQLLIEAALRTPGLRYDPSPFVRQGALATFCVDYTINAYLERPEDRLEVTSNLHANIQDAFNEAGIQIMTPAFESQPNEPVIVPKSQWNEGGSAPNRNTPNTP